MAHWAKHAQFGDLCDCQWASRLNHHINARELFKIWANSHFSVTMYIKYGNIYEEEHKTTGKLRHLSVLQCQTWPNEFKRQLLDSRTTHTLLRCEFLYLTIKTDAVNISAVSSMNFSGSVTQQWSRSVQNDSGSVWWVRGEVLWRQQQPVQCLHTFD